MCEYCGHGYENKPIYEDFYSTIGLNEEDKLEIDYNENYPYGSNYFYKCVKINFCPMCGKKLKKIKRES